jgi:hypothetical protein
MQNKNIQDEEKDGYLDIVDEMQETTGCSNKVLKTETGTGTGRGSNLNRNRNR